MLSSPEGRSTSIVSVTDRDSIHSNEGMAVPSPRVVLPVVHIESTSDSDDWTDPSMLEKMYAAAESADAAAGIDEGVAGALCRPRSEHHSSDLCVAAFAAAVRIDARN